MTGALWATALLALVTATAALMTALALARRYRELRAALLATGVLAVPRAVDAGNPEDSFLPVAGRPVPRGLRVTTTDGTVLDADYFAAPELAMVFLMDQCTACVTHLPQLRAALAALPPTAPRPVVVLSGPPEVLADFRTELEPVAHVVEDGMVKSGGGVVMAFQVHSFPTVLVLAGGAVARAGTTVEEAALTPA
jgi:hypothetical protein